jgi:hypothetical protein
MSNEQFERRMEFILEQQAKLEENFAKQQEHNAQAIARMDLVDRQISELVGFTDVLRDALIGLTHHAERHDMEIAEWIERGKETDARLNALMLNVERQISGHQ